MLQNYWNLTIRLFSVCYIQDTGGEGVLHLYRDAVSVFYSPSLLGNTQS